MTREKVALELTKIQEKMEMLKKREKQLQEQKKELDEIEILKVTKKMGITPEQLWLLNRLNEKEIKAFLAEREKEIASNQTEEKERN